MRPNGPLQHYWYDTGVLEGAAVGFGLMCWAYAIKNNHPLAGRPRSYWSSSIDGEEMYDTNCAGCGCGLNSLVVGFDDGSSIDLCGICYDRYPNGRT